VSVQEKLLKQLLHEFKGMKSQITGINSEITGMKSEITGMKSEITGMKSEITGMKSEITGIKSTMATKEDIESIHVKLDKLSENVQIQHVENINSDNLLLNEIRTLNEGVIFINRKVADTELEINLLKHNKQ
jgi:predicted  nucleic acid-binding Zn-ribbon protein